MLSLADCYIFLLYIHIMQAVQAVRKMNSVNGNITC